MRPFLLLALLALAPALHAQAPSDPLTGRLVLGATARALPAGTGHVSLRGMGVAFLPALAAGQVSVGVGRGVTLGGAGTLTIAGDHRYVGSAKWTYTPQNGVHVAVGSHAVYRAPGDAYGRADTRVLGFGAVTVERGGLAVTAEVSRRLGRTDPYRPGSRTAVLVGAEAAFAPGARLIVEATRDDLTGESLSSRAERPVLVIAGLRLYGRRGAFELGLGGMPTEFDACGESEGFCLPPVFPHLSAAVAFGRR